MDKKKVYIVTNHDNNYSTAIKLSEEQVKAIQWFIDLDDVNYSVCLPEDCCCEEILNVCGGEAAIYGGMREGLVFRSIDGVNSFKAVDNNFLVKYHG